MSPSHVAPHGRLRQILDEQGYAVIPGLVTAAEVDRIREAFDRLVAVARGLDGTCDIGGSRFVLEASPFRLHRVVWCGGAEPALEPPGGDARFVGLASDALEVNPVAQLIQQAHFKLPGDGVDFAWHQDASNRRYGTDQWRDLDGRGSFVQIALAVDPMHRANGGLGVIPGSHRLGFVAEPGSGVLPAGAFDVSRAVYPDLDPGDALVFGPFLVHGSAVNRTEEPRRLFIQGYATPGANRRIYVGSGLGVERTLG